MKKIYALLILISSTHLHASKNSTDVYDELKVVKSLAIELVKLMQKHITETTQRLDALEHRLIPLEQRMQDTVTGHSTLKRELKNLQDRLQRKETLESLRKASQAGQSR